MRNLWLNVIVAVIISCSLFVVFVLNGSRVWRFLDKPTFSSSLCNINKNDQFEAKNERILLTAEGRETLLRQLVSSHLLGDGDTFNKMFHFLSLLDDNCSTLLIPEAQSLNSSFYFKAKRSEMEKKLATAGHVNEGFSGQVTGQVLFYMLLARQPWVRQVCEIGFNAGHSALYWLASSNRTNLLSFDLGYHKYAKVMAEYMGSAYPGRFQVVWGDSTKVIPQFVQQLVASGKMISCDVIVVDGGHSYDVAITDLRNMRAFAGSSRHLLLMDDTPCVAGYCDGPTKAWREMRNFVKPLFGCMNYPNMGRGFSVGYYVV